MLTICLFIRLVPEQEQKALHRVPKKQPLCFLVITSANEHRFSQFFTDFHNSFILDSAGNFLQNFIDFHLTFDVLLHYLAKSEIRYSF